MAAGDGSNVGTCPYQFCAKQNTFKFRGTAGGPGTSQARVRLFAMHERKQIAKAARAQQELDAPAAWKDYRDAQARRLENLARLRAERMRQSAEQNEKPDA